MRRERTNLFPRRKMKFCDTLNLPGPLTGKVDL